QEEITTVLKKCEEFEFTRLIADEGIAVFELLKKLNYDGDKKYFKLVVMLTREQAMRYPKYLMLEKKLKAELSPPEKAVLQLMAQGKKNNEIADFLSITVSTVKFHSGNIYVKLDVTNRSQAIKVAHELKLI
ncbi:MAG: LuxR C-terminal-related transcriptional regulator, partial [Longicatena sp.]